MHRDILQKLADDANETIAARAAATLERKPAFDRERYGRLRLKSPSVRRGIVAAIVVAWIGALAFSDHDPKPDPTSTSALDAFNKLAHPPSTLATVSQISSPGAARSLPGGGEVRSGDMEIEIAAGVEALVVTRVTGEVGSLEFDWLASAPFVIEPGSILRFSTGPLQSTTIAVTCRVGEEPNRRITLIPKADSQ